MKTDNDQLITDIIAQLDVLTTNMEYELHRLSPDSHGGVANNDYAKGWIDGTEYASDELAYLLDDARKLKTFIRDEMRRSQPAIEPSPGQLPLMSEDTN